MTSMTLSSVFLVKYLIINYSVASDFLFISW